MVKYAAIAAALALAVMGAALWWQTKRLDAAQEHIGKLEHSNRQLTETVNAKTNATKQRARSDQVVRDLPDDDLARRLR